ncbi:hypothetical protein KC19_2G146600 [Ceratodon purpureus]|uniref:Uncharacterized protein n=1 Tax=Ceratodon purpureus TaxID=3225 RepID=A0A8T0IVH6_CERPU|nr:hypothetical protein KC19_2G146600 [Ceratodon purpureus]
MMQIHKENHERKIKTIDNEDTGYIREAHVITEKVQQRFQRRLLLAIVCHNFTNSFTKHSRYDNTNIMIASPGVILCKFNLKKPYCRLITNDIQNQKSPKQIKRQVFT